MRIWNYHPDTFVYLGEGEADESPLDPPGTFLIPAHATDIGPPPEPQEGYETTFLDGAWSNVEIPPPPEPEEPKGPDGEPLPPPRDIPAELDDLKARIEKIEAAQ